MAVPYTFQYSTGNIPLSELDANFTYFTTSLVMTGANTNVLGNFSVNGTTTFTGGVTIPSVSISGNATFTGTGNRIIGDFTNATVANRVAFQTSTTNSNTNVQIIPNGTGSGATLNLRNASDPTNAGTFNLICNATAATVSSTINGTGTYLPLTFVAGGSERMRLDTSGNLGIGTTAPTTKLTISNNTVLPSAGAIANTGIWQAGADALSNNILLDAFGVGGGAYINGRRSLGTSASPSGVGANINLLSLAGFGYGATGYSSTSRVAIGLFTNEVWTDTAQATKITFSTTPAGTTTIAERMRIDDAGNVGIGNTPSGSFKLEVTGSASTSGSITIGTNGVYTFGSIYSDTNWGMLFRAKQATPAQADFAWKNSADVERMRISAAGGVSIGTTTDAGATNLLVAGTTTSTGLATFNGGITAVGALTFTGSTTSNITLGSAQTTGTLGIGGASQTGTLTLGQSTVSQTTNIQAGVTSTGNTKAINVGTSGASGSTTNITMGSATAGSTTTSIIYGNLTYTPANVADLLTLGGTTQTGTLTLGQSTVSQTTNIGAGVTSTGNTKAINIGTNGAAGSTTNITLGSTSSGGTTTFNGTISATGSMLLGGSTTGNIALGTSTTTATIQIGGTSSSGTFTLGQSTTSQTTNIQAGAMVSGQTKTINIGTAGLSGSTTTIAIGSAVSGATTTTTVNGILKSQVYTVATLPSAVTSGAGAKSFVSDASVVAGNFGNTVVGGGALPCPVWSDGTNWKIG